MYNENGSYILPEGFVFYTEDEISVLDSVYYAMLGRDFEDSLVDLYLIADKYVEGDKEINDLCGLKECLCNNPNYIDDNKWKDMGMHELLYEATLSEMPLHLNYSKDSLDVVKSIIAMWRLKIGH